MVVCHAKDPGAHVVDALSLAQNGIQPQEHLLSGLLRLGRDQPQRQQIAIHIFPRGFEQFGDRILRESSAVAPVKPRPGAVAHL
jgi:hypothetical protein